MKDETSDPGFKIDLVVNEGAKVAVFHTKPFRKKLSWLEFDLDQSRLDFVMGDGDVRNFGTPIPRHFAREMQNAHQVLMVLMDEDAGEPVASGYFPLILHKK
ncbi:MAG: hypothetical protein EOM26_08345 [Alphaproteobacteria bacterium]|nr:hypothetical protein [Alphaproteobacteria bacterium]